MKKLKLANVIFKTNSDGYITKLEKIPGYGSKHWGYYIRGDKVVTVHDYDTSYSNTQEEAWEKAIKKGEEIIANAKWERNHHKLREIK